MLSFNFAPTGGVDSRRRARARGLFGKLAAITALMTWPLAAHAAAPVITSPSAIDVYYSADDGQNGMYFSHRVMATGEPTSFAASGLPAWCTFNTSTGVLFGSTQTPGVANVTISATNAEGTASTIVQIRSHPAPIGVSADGGVFYPGETLWFSVDFNAVVQTSGSPVLKFRIGTEDYREASLDSGSGTTRLRFAYLVRDDERSGDVAMVGLDSSAGRISDANGLTAGTSLPLRYAQQTARVEARALTPLGDPSATLRPEDVVALAGAPATLALDAGAAAAYQWRLNGESVSGANAGTWTIAAVEPAHAGLYTVNVTSEGKTIETLPAILGVTTLAKTAGAAAEVGADILHQNGNFYDQVLLQGRAAAVTANPGQVTRVSFLDLSDDIVQVEFSGAGTLAISLDNFSPPAEAVNYNQPGVRYAKGHARIVVAGADETTHLSVFSIGRANAVNQTLFKDGVDYDGVADVASIAISSANGRFGGVRAGNASFVATTGVAGIFAPKVAFEHAVTIGDISAADGATPVLRLGTAGTVQVAGGDLAQPNGRAIEISGISEVRMAAGMTSHGELLSAQAIGGRLVEEDGDDVTSRVAGSGQ